MRHRKSFSPIETALAAAFGAIPRKQPVLTVEEKLRNMFLQSLRAKLELCRLVAARLMEELEHPARNTLEKRCLFRRWEDMTRNGDTLEFVLDLLRRHEWEEAQRATKVDISCCPEESIVSSD